MVNRGGWKVIPETENVEGERRNKVEEVPHTRPEGNALELHAKGFVDAIMSNDAAKLTCEIGKGSIAAINAQMGNIAYKTGKKIYWEEDKGKFTDSEANKLIKADYHNGWKLPKI